MNIPNPNARDDAQADCVECGSAEWWSACMDGETDPGTVQASVEAWKRDASARQIWSDFHRIGDIARSSDLTGLADDAAYLDRLRARMAQEPVLLAPQPELLNASAARAPAPPWQRVNRFARRFAAPIGIAAGVAMVSSAVWVLQPGGPPSGQELAQNGPSRVPQRASEAGSVFANREAAALYAVEFEPYLSAHKQFQPSNIQGPASGFLRSAIYESPR